MMTMPLASAQDVCECTMITMKIATHRRAPAFRRRPQRDNGRQMYDVMRYWDDDQPEWNAEERAFAAAWRKQPKWVVSRSLKSVGPNASLVGNDLEREIRELNAERDGENEVGGTNVAHSMNVVW